MEEQLDVVWNRVLQKVQNPADASPLKMKVVVARQTTEKLGGGGPIPGFQPERQHIIDEPGKACPAKNAFQSHRASEQREDFAAKNRRLPPSSQLRQEQFGIVTAPFLSQHSCDQHGQFVDDYE